MRFSGNNDLVFNEVTPPVLFISALFGIRDQLRTTNRGKTVENKEKDILLEEGLIF